MSTLHRLGSEPNLPVYQQLACQILSYLDQDSQRAVAFVGKGLNQHVATFHLVKGVEELFDSIARGQSNTSPFRTLRSDTFLHLLSFLGPRERVITHLVCRHWNNGLDRLTLNEKNAAISKRFEPLRKTLGLLREHFAVHPNITSEGKEIIEQILKGILPDRKDVEDLAQVEMLEDLAQVEVAGLLRDLSAEEIAAFFEFSDFSKDNNLARFLNFIIKYTPLSQEGAQKDQKSLNALLDTNPYISRTNLPGILENILLQAREESEKGDSTLALQLVTIYSEIVPDWPIDSDAFKEIALQLMKRDDFPAVFQIMELYSKIGSEGILGEKARVIGSISSEFAAKGAFDEAVATVVLCSKIDSILAERVATASRIGGELVKAEAFEHILQLVELCVTMAIEEDMENWGHVLQEIVSTIDDANWAVECGYPRLSSEIIALVSKKIIENMGHREEISRLAIAEAEVGNFITAIPLAEIYATMSSEEPWRKAQTLATIGVELLKQDCSIDGIRTQTAAHRIAELCADTLPKDLPEKAEAFKALGCASTNLSHPLAFDVAILCSTTVSDIPEKAQAIGGIGGELIRNGYRHLVATITQLCCESATKENLEDWIGALRHMAHVANKLGQDDVARSIDLKNFELQLSFVRLGPELL